MKHRHDADAPAVADAAGDARHAKADDASDVRQRNDEDARPVPPRCLTRADLEQNLPQRHLLESESGCRVLSDEELERSRTALLACCPGRDVWVFAYGSLIWNPLFAHVEQQRARIHGYHREFCHWSMIGRGTAKRPGLVLGLDRGGSCRGIVYRLPPDDVETDLTLLWRREMVVGSYAPRWVEARLAGGRSVHAIAFVVDRRHAQYAARLGEEQVARTLASARGLWGTNRDYFEQTRSGLLAHGIVDAHLERVARILDQIAPIPERVA